MDIQKQSIQEDRTVLHLGDQNASRSGVESRGPVCPEYSQACHDYETHCLRYYRCGDCRQAARTSRNSQTGPRSWPALEGRTGSDAA